MAGGGQPQGQAQQPPGYAGGGPLNAPLQFGKQVNPIPQFNTQSGYNNFASPNQNFMQYPQQGQPNQPNPPALNNNVPPVQNIGGPDAGGDYPPVDMGFDQSGSDGGVGGHPADQMQSPLQQWGKPPSISQYMSPQGLQIQGDPNAMLVRRPQQR